MPLLLNRKLAVVPDRDVALLEACVRANMDHAMGDLDGASAVRRRCCLLLRVPTPAPDSLPQPQTFPCATPLLTMHSCLQMPYFGCSLGATWSGRLPIKRSPRGRQRGVRAGPAALQASQSARSFDDSVVIRSIHSRPARGRRNDRRGGGRTLRQPLFRGRPTDKPP
jgi:hypothetical protein